MHLTPEQASTAVDLILKLVALVILPVLAQGAHRLLDAARDNKRVQSALGGNQAIAQVAHMAVLAVEQTMAGASGQAKKEAAVVKACGALRAMGWEVDEHVVQAVADQTEALVLGMLNDMQSPVGGPGLPRAQATFVTRGALKHASGRADKGDFNA